MSIKFKRTKISKISKDWKLSTLDGLADVYDNKRIPLSEMERANRKGKYPYCGANGVLDYIDDYIFDGEFVLLAEDGGSYGKFETSCYMMNEKFWVNNHAHILQAKEGKSTNSFLLYMFNFLDLRSYIVGSTRRKLNQEYLKQIKIMCPPILEQQKIAEILGTVDKAIEKVYEAIANTERLKKGLMQEFLTKGIGHKDFKDTEIGRIPKQWEVGLLGDKNIAELIMGQSPPSSTYNTRKLGLPFLQGKMEFGYMYPNPKLYCSKPIKIVKNEDILLSVRAPVGDVNISPFECCIGRGLAGIRSNREILNHIFLFYFLKLYGRKFEQLSTGSTFKAIKKLDITSFIIPLPSLYEQQKIAEILDNLDKRLELLKAKKQQFESVKKGLMGDLLTGKRRVKV